MKTAHIIYVPFTGLGKIWRGDKWLENRIQIFKQFVLASLMKQPNMNYFLWISWRPEDETNPLVINLQRHLATLKGLTMVCTFHGLCFYDDKYDNETACRRLSHNLTMSLPYLKNHVDWADQVIMTIQPSDDLYMIDMVDKIRNFEFDKVAGFTKGYIINYNTKEICEYNPDTIPPFFSIKFPVETFLDPEKHFYYTGPYQSHEYVKDLGFKEIPGRGFIVGTHGENISTTWNIPFKGKPVENQDLIWLKSGILLVPPLKIKESRNYKLRKIYNYLPFKSLIKRIYYAIK
jgi:hypothetical protein